eukprot:6559-Heterococcus_DN1.PRE.1
MPKRALTAGTSCVESSTAVNSMPDSAATSSGTCCSSAVASVELSAAELVLRSISCSLDS